LTSRGEEEKSRVVVEEPIPKGYLLGLLASLDASALLYSRSIGLRMREEEAS